MSQTVECPRFSPVYTSTSWWDESEVLDKMSCGFDLFKSAGSDLTVWLLRREQRESRSSAQVVAYAGCSFSFMCAAGFMSGIRLEEAAWGAVLHQASGAGSLQSMCAVMSWGTCQLMGPWYLSVPDSCVEEERRGGGVRAHDKAGWP